MITNVTICDRCKTRVAEHKCDYCGVDLCKDCHSNLTIYINGISGLIINTIIFCSDCRYNKLTNFRSNKPIDVTGKIKKDILETIKKLEVADSI